MSTGVVNQPNLEKQMGCMTGFLQLFDRHQILSGKRHYSAKGLPPSPVGDTTSESECSAPQSPAISREFTKPSPDRTKPPQSPLAYELRPKSPLPVLELKEGTRSSWKFCKEAPRLSLDSRATTDAKGGLHPKEIRTAATAVSRCESVASDFTDDSQHSRSPSVIARLMGLEPLPDSSTFEPEKKPELRRSASESRVSRDLFNSRFIAENSNFKQCQSQSVLSNNGVNDYPPLDAHYADPRSYMMKKNGNKVEAARGGVNSPWRAPPQRKSFFDSGDFFPEPKQSLSIYGEIGLKMRGIDEPAKDLETLKQFLEALQLKGLLHSRKLSEQNQFGHRNFVYDESPIVVMRPSRLSNPAPSNRRKGNDYSPSNGRNQSSGVRRSYNQAGESSPSMSPRRERSVKSPTRTSRSPSPTTSSRVEGNAIGKRSNSLVKPKPLTVETQRRVNESPPNRRVHSPKLNSRRAVQDPTASNRSPRSKKATPEIHHKEKNPIVAGAEDESSSISGSSITTTTDTTERSKTEDYKEGRTLLDRCDKLLHSIAEMNATDMQPSPVSVLDSSLYESSTPSPVTTRRNLDFKDELEDEIWSPISAVGSKYEEISDDSDFAYISDILRASHYLPEDSDVFLLLEKQQYLKGNDKSRVSTLQRKLVFDTINEILDKKRRLPPWKVNQSTTRASVDKIWPEFQRIRELYTSEDLFETICGVLKKDLTGDALDGWGECPMETSDMVLDIERLIFKDLISDTIRDLAALASRSTAMPRRKLVF